MEGDSSEADAPSLWPVALDVCAEGGDEHFFSGTPANGVPVYHASALMLKYQQGTWLRNTVKITTANL